jgi:uroporphyrinogen-III synthase
MMVIHKHECLKEKELMSKDRSLAGMGVVVTRPVHQAEGLCQLIESLGGEAIRFPTLVISEPRDPTLAQAVIDHLEDYQMAIFTSANAVRWGLRWGLERRFSELPTLQRVAIGKATAQTLAQHNAPAQWVSPPPFNSEALLELPVLQSVDGLRIVIFCGEGGRTLLGATLRQRGAQVTKAPVYRRGLPAVSVDPLLQYWEQGEIQAVVVTSTESLKNFFALAGEVAKPWLCRTPLVVVSSRSQQMALQLGAQSLPLIASEASDAAIVETLIELGSLRRFN